VKANAFILPLVALAIAGVFLGVQRKDISKLQSESAELRRHIAEANDAAQAPDIPSSRQQGNPAADEEPIDWKKLAGEIGAIKRQDGIGDMRKMMALKRRLLGMESWELVAALDQIAFLDVDGETRMILEGLILDPLAKKDPETALNRFKDRLGEQRGGMSWQLSAALASWAGKDMAAATAWYDRELSAGTFDSKSLDGKSPLRDLFESKLVAKMLESDLSGAKSWLSGKTADARKEILSGPGFQNLQEKDHAAHAELIRSQLDDAGRLDLIGRRVANMVLGVPFTEVDAYLDRIDARPDERLRSVENAAETIVRSKASGGELTEVEIDEMREWAGKIAPESVNRITGESLGSAMGGYKGIDPNQAYGLALKYHASTGSDDVLVGFLNKASGSASKVQAREIAAKISDPRKREEMMRNFD
jgi:hypothetical protein